MGLAKRIIPTLLCRGRQLIKGRAFASWRSVGVAAQAVRVHQARGVDELVLLDISATPEARGPDLTLVEDLAEVCFMPLAVGGGIRRIEDVRNLLKAGADKVVLGAQAYRNPALVRDIAATVGSQALVVAVDVEADGSVRHGPGARADQWARAMQVLGAGEIMVTSVPREGALDGYDLDLIRSVALAVTIPVVAHGGCGTPQHMLEALQAGADAVAAGSMFQFTDTTPRAAAAYLQAAGMEVRV